MAQSTLDFFTEKLKNKTIDEQFLLDNNFEKAHHLLKALGIIHDGNVNLKDLVDFFNDPEAVLNKAYKWGASDFKGEKLSENLRDLVKAFDFDVLDEAIQEGVKDHLDILGTPRKFVLLDQKISGVQTKFGFYLFIIPAPNPGVGMSLFIDGSLSNDLEVPIVKGNQNNANNIVLSLLFNVGVNIDEGLGITIQPGKLGLVKSNGAGPGSSIQLKYGLKFKKENNEPIVLLKMGDDSRIEFGSAQTAIIGKVNTKGKFELVYEANIKDGKIVIKPGKNDNFLKKLVGENGIESNFELPIAWGVEGILFPGSGGLEIAIPTHIQIGPIEIQGLTLRAQPKGKDFTASVSADIKGTLGPMDAVVKGMGFKGIFSFPTNEKVDFTPAFVPPTGVGLSIDGGGFVGGGFLFLDFDKGEYAGGLELEFKGTIALKAIGILNTKMPDGSDGFSLLIIITAEFIPIQLGFGFTLIGVGGLLGLNRTMELEPMRLGVYDGSLNSILFPKDVVANANRIIKDIQRIFPPYEGNFIFGPMAKLGWGTPTLISLELGLVIEVPNPVRLAILGVMRLNLPTEQLAIIYIQINFLATIDFDKKQFTLDASLINSRILTFTLTGDMAIRIYWGDDANFLFTVGGFHPAFKPPPLGLPALKRLSLIIFSGNPEVRAESYFAITSNTVQFGAKLSLSASAGPAEVHGYLSLDALIQFNPFYFLVEFGAMLAVSIFGEDLLSVRVKMSLEGPAPWHAWGTAEVSISFFFFSIDVTVSFDVTFGKDKKEIAPPVEVFEPLIKALRNQGNWEVQSVPGTNLMVSLRQISKEEQGDDLILHPSGVIQVSQKVVPLYLSINKFGENVPKPGQTYFEIEALKIGNDIFPTSELKEQFAPAQFNKMTDSEKLSKKSFEKLRSGVKLKGSDKLEASYVAAMDAAYELSYVPDTRGFVIFMILEFLVELLHKNSAASKSALSYEPKRRSALDAPQMSTNSESFVIANADTLTMHRKDLVFESEAEADVAYKQMVSANPALVTELAVMPKYQLN